MSQFTRAYQLAFLLVGEAEGAAEALLETIRLQAGAETIPLTDLAHAALRQAAQRSPDRFFLRSLANPDGITAQVDRLPVTERTALVLDGVGELSHDQIALLLRMPKESARELLARTWRQVGQERGELSAALLATVDPIPAGLEHRLQAVLDGSDSATADIAAPEAGVGPFMKPSEADRRAPRLRKPWLGLAFAILLAALFAIRWWPRATDAVATGVERPVVEAPAPATSTAEIPQEQPVVQATRFDFRTFTPESIQSFTAFGMPVPAHEGVQEIAAMVLQWLGEATIVGEASLISAGDSPFSLSLRAKDGRSLWLQLDHFCTVNIDECFITVGGEGQTPVRLHQADLTRWFLAGGWTRAFRMPNSVMTYPDQGERVRTEDEIRRLAERDATPGVYEITVSKQALLRLTQEAGGWRTAGEPAWMTFLRPQEAGQTKGEILIYRDSDGALLERREVHFTRS